MSSITRSKIKVVPHFKRLHELIAYDKGFFQKEGLDVEFDERVLDETHNAPDFPRITGEELAIENYQNMNAACNWGVCVSAGAGMGKLVRDVHFKTENAIFVREDSDIYSPKDLANVPVGVGELSGSHFSAIQTMETYLPRESISVKLVGGPLTRVRKLMSRELKAANLIPPGIYIARQLGFREVVGGTYKTLLWAGNMTSSSSVKAYVRALERAQDVMMESPECKKYWWRLLHDEFKGVVDVSRFGLGEILVSEPYTEAEYQGVLDWMRSWHLTDRMLEQSYSKIIVA